MINPELRKLYPFESHVLRIGGYRYHYLDEGRGEEALVMLHGNPTWSFYYRHLVLAFRDRYRVIVPDHMGCGLSDKPQSYRYQLDQHISNLERLLETLQVTQLTLVMHDWGGAIGMGYAVRHPERIKRLVVFNTAAFRSSKIPLRINLCRIPVVGDIAVRLFNGFAGGAIYMATTKRMAPGVKAGYLLPYNSYRNRIATLRFVQDIPLEARHPSYSTLVEIEQGLHQFKNHPMLIIWGNKDWCFTRDHFLLRWKARFPQAEIHEFEDAGHYVVEDAHERIIPLMELFLQKDNIG
ncbi:MAG: alpha/beta fold hydrolase [Gemmatimonadetes bacterium]|nr:MAG: alpha/beta fold hydrolase [Gemmatimonadota bacterium]